MMYDLDKIMNIAEKEKDLGRDITFATHENGNITLESTWDEDGITCHKMIDVDDCKMEKLN